MLDHTAATLAFRARALGATVATTGSISIAATATGYTRQTGSFLTDGFRPGQEVGPAGFGSNPTDIITFVDATTVTTKNSHAVEASAGGRSLTVGMPAMRALENERFTRNPARPYIEEEFVPATASLETLPARNGQVEETGLYVLRIYGLAGYGIPGLRSYVEALRARFTPGTTMTAGSDTIRVRSDVSTQAGQILPQDNGWAVCTLRVPWKARTTNAIAA